MTACLIKGRITTSTPKIKILLTVTVSAVSVSRTHAISRSQLSPIMEAKSFILTAAAEGAKSCVTVPLETYTPISLLTLHIYQC